MIKKCFIRGVDHHGSASTNLLINYLCTLKSCYGQV